MKVITIASQKGGAGKSTFAVNLATLADRTGSPALLIDTDPQGSISVWRQLRASRTPILVPCRADELEKVLDTARRQGSIEWVFIDGPPQNGEEIAMLMAASTLVVIPTRPAIFDLASVAATIGMARSVKRPFFVALNAVPPRRGVTEQPTVLAARKAIKDMGAPLWRGSIVQRSVYAQALSTGEAVVEADPGGSASQEMRSLWRDVSQAAEAMAAY